MKDWNSWYDQENIQAVIDAKRKLRGENLLAHPYRSITYIENNKPLNMARVRLDNNQSSQIYIHISPPQRGLNITPADFQTAMQSETERLLMSNKLNASGKKQAFIFQAHVGDNHWATYACNTEGEIMTINSMDGYEAWDNAAIKAFKGALRKNNITPKESIDITPRENRDFSQKNGNDCGPITAAISCKISGEKSFSHQREKLENKIKEYCKPGQGLREKQKNRVKIAQSDENLQAPIARDNVREHNKPEKTSYSRIISHINRQTPIKQHSPSQPTARSHSSGIEITAVAVTVDPHRSKPDGTAIQAENVSQMQKYKRFSTIHLSVSTDSQMKSFDLRADTVILNTFVKNKNTLMLSGGNGFIYKLDAASPQRRLEQIGNIHKSYVTSIGSVEKPGGEECCISSSANSVYIWNKDMKNAEIITIANCNKVIASVVGLKNGCIACVDRLGSLYVIDAEKNVHTIDQKSPKSSPDLTGEQVNLTQLSLNQQGKLVQHDKEGKIFDDSIEDKIENYFKKLESDVDNSAEIRMFM